MTSPVRVRRSPGFRRTAWATIRCRAVNSPGSSSVPSRAGSVSSAQSAPGPHASPMTTRDPGDRQSPGRTPVGEVRTQQRARAAQIVGLGRVGDRYSSRALLARSVVHALGGGPGGMTLGAQLGDRSMPAAAHRPPPSVPGVVSPSEATRMVRHATLPGSVLPAGEVRVRPVQAATGSRDQFRSTWVAPSRTTMGPCSLSRRRYSLPPEFGFLYPAHLPRSTCDRATPAAWWAM